MPSPTHADLDAAVEAARRGVWHGFDADDEPDEGYASQTLDALIAAVEQRERAKYEALVEAAQDMLVRCLTQRHDPETPALIAARAELRAALRTSPTGEEVPDA